MHHGVAFFHDVTIRKFRRKQEDLTSQFNYNQSCREHADFSLVRRNIFLTPVRKCENSTEIRESIVPLRAACYDLIIYKIMEYVSE